MTCIKFNLFFRKELLETEQVIQKSAMNIVRFNELYVDFVRTRCA